MVEISIIVPVYNVEQYLNKCIDSILNQTFTDFEIILIDDGSIDNSGIICDYYSKNDNRVKVIHKKNEGVSVARNIGLDIAIGEYVGFVDADDYVLNETFEKLYKIAKNSGAEIILFDSIRRFGIYEGYYSNGEYLNILKYNFVDINPDGETDSFPPQVWTRLIKRELIEINKIRFDSRLMKGEDRLFTWLCSFYSKDLYYLPNSSYYIYQNRQGSATHLYHSDDFRYRKILLGKLYDLYNDKTQTIIKRKIIKDIIPLSCFIFIKGSILQEYKSSKSKEERIAFLFEIINDPITSLIAEVDRSRLCKDFQQYYDCICNKEVKRLDKYILKKRKKSIFYRISQKIKSLLFKK